MNESAIIILMVDAAEGAVEGRTTLQKWCYFAAVKTGLDLGYKPHFYGPYSEAISRAMNDLITSDFLVERGRMTYHGRVLYSYSLTEDGEKIAEDLKEKDSKLHKSLKEIVETCTTTAGNNISILSWAAKVYFLLQRKGKEITYGEIKRVGRKLGWTLAENEIESGLRLLTALNLAKKGD
ncbi:MAG: hypothetical protein ABSB28_10615 [Candidatus Bathyarchaeia archaeon]